MSIFENNLNAILEVNQFLFQELKKIDGNYNYEVFFDEKNPKDINIVQNSSFTPMYKGKASQKITQQLEEFKYAQKYPYLYIFGIANGVFIKELLYNELHKTIYVVEPEIELLYIALNLIDFTKEINEKRVVLLLESQMQVSYMVDFFRKNDARYYARIYELYINTNFYEKFFSDSIVKSNKVFIECLHHFVQMLGNDAEDALIGFEHHLMNLPKLLQTPPLIELVNKAKNTEVAILVSTGPSLTKQLALLKKIQNHVTIFAVDASFPVLEKHGIKPDVVVSMERVPLTGRFFKDTSKQAHENVIFALSSIQHPEVVNSLKAGTMQMSMRPLDYMMYTGPKWWGYVGIGMSAANMAFEIISHSKFKTCVLIGQDLAYGKDGVSHASDHILGEAEVVHKKTDGWVECYGGGSQVRTTVIWNLFRTFFETDISDTKDVMETINATEGGARIQGCIEMLFKEVIEKKVDLKNVKKQIVLGKAKKSEIKRVTREVKKQTDLIEKYIKEQKLVVEKLFLEVADTCEELNSTKKVASSRIKELLENIEKFRENSKDKMYKQLIGFISQSILYAYEIQVSELTVKYLENDEEIEQNNIELLKNYKSWLFNLAGCINAISVAINRKGSQYKKVEE